MLSDKSEPVRLGTERLWSGGELPPFGQGDLPVFLEPVAVVEVAFEVEVIVDGRMDGGEHLKTSHSSEPEHRPLASS